MIVYLSAVVVFLLIFFLFEPLFLKENGKRNRAVVWKTSATLSAAALAGASLFGNAPVGCLWIFAGIAVSAISDAVIHFFLGAGALAFMAAHGCFITAYLLLGGTTALPLSALLFVLAVGGALLLFRPHFHKIGKMLPVCLVYVAILSAMFALAFPLVFTLGISALPITAGALFFYLSDLLVAKNVFLSSSPRSEGVAMTAYYAAEYLFALFALFAAF